MAVPDRYAEGGDPAVISYDFFDISTGTQYVNFYPFSTWETTAEVKSITSEDNLASYKVGTSAGVNTAMNFDFDFTLAFALTIKGKAYINIPFGFVGSAGVPTPTYTISLYKVVGVTETLLGTQAVCTRNASFINTGMNTQMLSVSMNIATPVSFAPGDKLRLSVEITSPGASKEIIMFHDPKNRSATEYLPLYTGASATTQSKINLPVKIQN
jgi:hypothetical protein